MFRQEVVTTRRPFLRIAIGVDGKRATIINISITSPAIRQIDLREYSESNEACRMSLRTVNTEAKLNG